MKDVKLSKRLQIIAENIKTSRLYDIGTDHGYLPVYAVRHMNVVSAVASDVAPLPLEKAKKLIAEHHLGDRISAVISDGADALQIVPPCDVVIAGMGGELIAKILENTSLRKDGVNLILQPMTKTEYLREYLANNGFAIESETDVYDDKIYEIIRASFGGAEYGMSDAELLVGRTETQTDPAAHILLVEKKIAQLERNVRGMKSAGLDTEKEEKIIFELGKIKDDCERNIRVS